MVMNFVLRNIYYFIVIKCFYIKGTKTITKEFYKNVSLRVVQTKGNWKLHLHLHVKRKTQKEGRQSSHNTRNNT